MPGDEYLWRNMGAAHAYMIGSIILLTGAKFSGYIAAKEYLSKALLEYALSLELLPEIHDTGNQTKIECS